MSAEVGVGLGIKIFGGAIMAFVTGAVGHIYWMLRRDKTKLDNTYTKEETEELIDLKTLSKEDTAELVDLKLEPTKQKVDTIFELLHTMNETTTKTNESIEGVGKGIAVLQNDMEHVKEDIKELKRNKKDK